MTSSEDPEWAPTIYEDPPPYVAPSERTIQNNNPIHTHHETHTSIPHEYATENYNRAVVHARKVRETVGYLWALLCIHVCVFILILSLDIYILVLHSTILFSTGWAALSSNSVSEATSRKRLLRILYCCLYCIVLLFGYLLFLGFSMYSSDDDFSEFILYLLLAGGSVIVIYLYIPPLKAIRGMINIL